MPSRRRRSRAQNELDKKSNTTTNSSSKSARHQHSSGGRSLTRPNPETLDQHEYEVPEETINRRRRSVPRQESRKSSGSKRRSNSAFIPRNQSLDRSKAPKPPPRPPRRSRSISSNRVYDIPDNSDNAGFKRHSTAAWARNNFEENEFRSEGRRTISGQIQDDILVIRRESSWCGKRFAQRVSTILRKWVSAFGRIVSRYPYPVLATCTILLVLAMVGFMLRGAALKTGGVLGYIDPYGSPQQARNKGFNSSRPEFDTIYRGKTGDFAVLLSTDNVNVLTPGYMRIFEKLKHDIEDIAVERDSDVYWYHTICRYKESFCEKDVLKDIAELQDQTQLFYPVHVDSKTNRSLYLGNSLGGIDLNLANEILSAKALHRGFYIKTDENTAIWSEKFAKVVDLSVGAKSYSVNYWSYKEFDTEVNQMMKITYYCLAGSLAIFVLMSTIARALDCFSIQRLLLGLASALTAAGCVAASVSLTILATEEYYPGLYNTVFGVLGAMLVLQLGFETRCTNIKQMKFRGSNAPPCPFTFMMGLQLRLGMTVALGFYAGSWITEFSALRQTCLAISMASVAGFTINTVLHTGLYSAIMGSFTSQEETGVGSRRPSSGTKTRKLSKKVSAMTASPCGRSACIVLLSLCLLIGVWGLTKTNVSLTETDLLPKSSQLNQYLAKHERYFRESGNFLELNFEGDVDYYNPQVFSAVEDILKSAENVAVNTIVISWLREYKKFEVESSYFISHTSFVSVLSSAFLEERPEFKSDIVIAAETQKIARSRMYINFPMLRNKEAISKMARKMLKKIESSGLPVTLKTPSLFNIYHDQNVLSNLALTLAGIIGVSTISHGILSGSVISFTVLCLTVFSITIVTLGFGALIGVPVNVFSAGSYLGLLPFVITLVAFSMESAIHSNRNTKLEQRIAQCLHFSIHSVCVPGITLVFASFPLLYQSVPIVRYTVVSTSISVVVSILFGVILVPFLLQLLTRPRGNCFNKCCQHLPFCQSEDDASSIFFIPTTPKTGTLSYPSFPKFAGENMSLPPPYSATVTEKPVTSALYANTRPDVIPAEPDGIGQSPGNRDLNQPPQVPPRNYPRRKASSNTKTSKNQDSAKPNKTGKEIGANIKIPNIPIPNNAPKNSSSDATESASSSTEAERSDSTASDTADSNSSSNHVYTVEEPNESVVLYSPEAADQSRQPSSFDLRNRQAYNEWVGSSENAQDDEFYMYPAQTAWEQSQMQPQQPTQMYTTSFHQPYHNNYMYYNMYSQNPNFTFFGQY